MSPGAPSETTTRQTPAARPPVKTERGASRLERPGERHAPSPIAVGDVSVKVVSVPLQSVAPVPKSVPLVAPAEHERIHEPGR